MDKKAFSSDGYIINQPCVHDVAYGKLPSSANGCGWMAAYNMFTALGKKCDWQQVHDDLASGVKFGGRFGTGPLRLYKYIKTKCPSAKISFTWHGISKNAKTAKAGIILYLRGKGAHYVAFARASDAEKGDSSAEKNISFRFFNADHSNENHTQTLYDFVCQWCKSITRIICTITVE